MTEEGVHPDGKPWVHPLTRAAWRGWLIVNHETSDGVHLITWRKATGKPSVGYGEAVEEALCVGWVDSKAGKLDDERSTLWFTTRRPRSGWSRPNKERVERLIAAGLMLSAGLAAIEEARRRGTSPFLAPGSCHSGPEHRQMSAYRAFGGQWSRHLDVQAVTGRDQRALRRSCMRDHARICIERRIAVLVRRQVLA